MKKMNFCFVWGLLLLSVTHLAPGWCTTPLYEAAARGKLSEVASLCKRPDVDLNLGKYNPFRETPGAPVLAGEEDREVTPLEIALRNNHLFVAERLRHYGAAPVDTNNSRHPLSFRQAVIGGDVELAHDYLTRDPELLYAPQDHSGCTVVDEAIRIGDRDMIEVFVERGLDLSRKMGVDNATCLEKAVSRRNIKMARYFIRYGANINVDRELGTSPLANAIKTGNVPMAQMLLEEGACTRNVARNGGSALLRAARTLRDIQSVIQGHQQDLRDVLLGSEEAEAIREGIKDEQESLKTAQEMIGMVMFQGGRVSDRERKILDPDVYDNALNEWKAKERKRVSLPGFFQRELGMDTKQGQSGFVRNLFSSKSRKRKCDEIENENVTMPPHKRRAR